MRQELPPTYRIPLNLARQIGHVIVSYAHLEWLLSRILFAALGIDAVEGRVALRDQSATERFDIIKRLLPLKEMAVPEGSKELRAAIESCQDQRNELAHG